MTVNVGELQYNGLLLNDVFGISIVSAVTGLDLPAMRTSDHPLPGAHGVTPGQDRLEARTIDMTVHVFAVGTATVHGGLLAIAAAMAPRDDEIPLTFRINAALPEMRVYCRPRRRSVPMPQNHAHGNARCDIQLVASDPLVYSEAESLTSAGSPVPSGGLSLSFAFPFNFGAAGSSGTVQLTNAGSAPAPWRVVVNGPCTGVSIIGPNGGLIRWDGALLVGETLVIDAHPARRTVLIGGTASRYGLVSPLTKWFLIAPGTSQILFQTDTATGSATFSWRDAWWSAA